MATELRDKFDRLSILTAKHTHPVFDLYSILAVTHKFSDYPKTATGLTDFFRTELFQRNVRYEKERFYTYIGHDIWHEYHPTDFLNLLLLPLYHCNWSPEMLAIRNQPSSPAASKLAAQLVPGAVTLDMVPEDWRDVVEEGIVKGTLVLANFKDLRELEQLVDTMLGLDETIPVPTSSSWNEPELAAEEKEAMAKTLGLHVDDFRTKQEALDLYARKSH